MTLRLVLVSLVAGLGISLPGWPILEGWVASTQKWMNARLAEMDYRPSDEKNYVVIHDLLKVEMERARTARHENRAAKSQSQPVVARSATSEAVDLATIEKTTWAQAEPLLSVARTIVGIIGDAYLSTAYVDDRGSYLPSVDGTRVGRAMRRLIDSAKKGQSCR